MISNNNYNQTNYLWTQNMSFISSQQEVLRNNTSQSPFMTCWKIFQIYNSRQMTISNDEQSKASQEYQAFKVQKLETKRTKKIIKNIKKNKISLSKRLCINI